MKDNMISLKSKQFALHIINLHRYLCDNQKEYILFKQLLRSGTGIGANIREAVYGQTKADFFSKMCISLKDATEISYWLELLHESGYLDDKSFDSIYSNCTELLKLLTAITKKVKNNSFLHLPFHSSLLIAH